MSRPHFNVDRLGMLSLRHFELENQANDLRYLHLKERSSISPSPLQWTDDWESPLTSPTENSFHENNENEDILDQTNDETFRYGVENHDKDRFSFEETTCRYRRGANVTGGGSKRNERERNRVRLISEGFGELRKHVMIQPCKRRLPKLQILRMAILYIKDLENMICESDMKQSLGHINRPSYCSPSVRPQKTYQEEHKHGEPCSGEE
ncbi:achaete-scute homolog 3-like [Xenia sp. Carnegie-2017]|uniref:achaete-scute homolog 3-like n=1 Tax=Xenia sp. Carnegie-2017 TaxID=2897299 RepID=UPI001F033FA1|nr:achaete-scute homolog 3-like [Xenia sp. Carnegie-2017]XP_046845297.1 achaete-scute homolog 3-like [Xenia sp. Carnegie-2017]